MPILRVLTRIAIRIPRWNMLLSTHRFITAQNRCQTSASNTSLRMSLSRDCTMPVLSLRLSVCLSISLSHSCFELIMLKRLNMIINGFYRATLCVSAVFAVAVAQCPYVCLSVRRQSVRPSVTLVHCIQTAKDIVKRFSQHGSPIILVF